ncbi:MAG: hypothetical protein MN733_03530 [Nitrososphaera sp.]|nr:hypothetical protein [Nitrososphaera sp.]
MPKILTRKKQTKNWPKFSDEELRKKIAKGGFAEGSTVCYIKWTAKVGLKVFAYKAERDGAMKMQKLASQSGIGPRVGPKTSWSFLSYDINSETFRDVELFGYWTEHVPKLGIRNGRHHGDVGELREQLRLIGISHVDLHYANVGWIGNRFVCIDFDNNSCYSTVSI